MASERAIDAFALKSINRMIDGPTMVRAEVSVRVPAKDAAAILKVARRYAHAKAVGQGAEHGYYLPGGEDLLVEEVERALPAEKWEAALAALQAAQHKIDCAQAVQRFTERVKDPEIAKEIVRDALRMDVLDGMSQAQRIQLLNRAEAGELRQS